ncbi:MAG: cysteine--tRNA ligase [Saprospiraceae bacterium]|nr:cysteine--tRNA ligase [Saprospiraceae bacterium]
MKQELVLYNSLNRKKETFKPIEEGYIGMYVCGPTVYSDVHLGNVRTFVSFDIIYRYLKYLGYTVRYVRNITDVGHLLDDGTDRISKGARAEKLEPMEVVQKYTLGFHDMMRIFNSEPPSIEPRASGHILEQIEMVQQILDNGLAYEKNGSVYFDVEKFAKEQDVYGKLSGRVIEDLFSETRELKNQGEKKHPADFAIWMKAAPDHLMRWNSPWSEGFPGWHLECSVMSTKYLGTTFDIHGGGNDLKFPHHENEVAQNFGACKCQPANFWLHTNMLLMNGRKMSKSDGNTISPEELFTGESPHVSQGYSPMVVRFFMLQTHYRSTMDLSDEALKASEKGYKRLMEARKTLQGFQAVQSASAGTVDEEISKLLDQALEHMSDDFNTPMALARMFEVVPKINGIRDGHIKAEELSAETLDRTKKVFDDFIFDIFGLQEEMASGKDGTTDGLMQLVIELRNHARSQKDWGTADKIRDTLKELEIQLKDAKGGDTTWVKA